MWHATRGSRCRVFNGHAVSRPDTPPEATPAADGRSPKCRTQHHRPPIAQFPIQRAKQQAAENCSSANGAKTTAIRKYPRPRRSDGWPQTTPTPRATPARRHPVQRHHITRGQHREPHAHTRHHQSFPQAPIRRRSPTHVHDVARRSRRARSENSASTRTRKAPRSRSPAPAPAKATMLLPAHRQPP